MNRLCTCFLVFLTLWMSTWLVTDVHEWSMVDDQHTHIQASIASRPASSETEHEHHNGICSYDHGGHIGQAIATINDSTSYTPAQNSTLSLYSALWQTQIPRKKLRPPIA